MKLRSGDNVMIEKIKAVKHDYSASSGPSRTITLGFKDTIEERDYILGVFYIGPYMEDRAEIETAACERTIDRMVTATRAYKASL